MYPVIIQHRVDTHFLPNQCFFLSLQKIKSILTESKKGVWKIFSTVLTTKVNKISPRFSGCLMRDDNPSKKMMNKVLFRGVHGLKPNQIYDFSLVPKSVLIKTGYFVNTVWI